MNWRALLFIPAVAAGVFLFVIQQRGDDAPEAAATEMIARPVEALDAEPGPIEVVITGFGRVEAVRTWEAVSQVDGRVLKAAEALAAGSIVEAGSTLLRVDPRSYEIARDRAAANLQTAEAQLAELDAQAESLSEQIALERRIEAVFQGERDRQRQLLDRGAVAESRLEQAERDLITQQRRVLDIQNQIDLISVQRVSAEATRRTREVELEEAERDLSNTEIVAPFTGRVLEEDVSEGEYIRPGDRLLTLAAVEAVEIAAEVQPSEVGAALPLLLPSADDGSVLLDLSDQDTARQALSASGIQAVVILNQGGRHEYEARIARVDGTIDDATGTIGLVVVVPDGGLPDLSRRRPPLTIGAFVSVEFRGTTRSDWRAIPRGAVQSEAGETFVYVADDADTLRRRSAERLGQANGRAIIDAALEAGDRILAAPPEPAILGQNLAVVESASE
ncbi:HlyD family efflux transporter periplasmic adaptor subunit [Rhodobacteraceae bacterium CCMM004]|nr:HlyD family efflux transporter periplasmic adaptor subunit [Rhodobacteraceae bacterium CCMM004]